MMEFSKAHSYDPLDLNELLDAVNKLKKHWVGKYLVKTYVSCYRGKNILVDLRQFKNLDRGNQNLFVGILNMREFGWCDETLYQVEQKLKKLVGIK